MYREDKLNEILEKFPHMYNIDIGSNNEFLISSILEEIKNLNKSIYDLANMLNIENAEGIWLDRLGIIFGIKREIDEEDKNLRIRILSFWLSISKNATLEIMIKFLLLAIENEENLFEYNKGNGIINIILNKRMRKDTRDTISNILTTIKAAGIQINLIFKYKIQIGYLGCGLSSAWNPHLWKYEEELVDRLKQVKTEETDLTKINVHSLFMR